MKEQNHPFDKLRTGKKVYSKKIIPILAIALIVAGIVLIVSLADNQKKKADIPYNPGNVEVVVIDNAGGTQNSQSQTTSGDNMVNNLGAATTGEINGGASNVQEGAGNTEKLLEGKEIEIK